MARSVADRWSRRFVCCLAGGALALGSSAASAQLKFREADLPTVRTAAPEQTGNSPDAVLPAFEPASGNGRAEKAEATSRPRRSTVTASGVRLASANEETSAAAETALATRVTEGNGTLPRDANQVWRDYDLTPYTSQVETTARPEQAVVDWILRETGTELWFSQPLGILSAGPDVLHVYHTEEVHQIVREIVDRFNSSAAETHAYAVRLVTVGNPNWRAKAIPLLRSVTAQSPGVDAWLLSREDAAVLFSELRKRNDFREHNSPNLVIQNGQSQTLSRTQPRNYVRSLRPRPNAVPAYELEMGQIQEGYSLQFSPLMSTDQRFIDIVLKCHIDQVERLIPVAVDVPSVSPQRQSAQLQVPQLVSWRLHERFRWQADQVLLLSCGVVATPSGGAAAAPVMFPNLLAAGGNSRADALLFVEYKGTENQAILTPEQAAERLRPGAARRF